ncbi:MAG: hypothetical protein JNK56_08105 [Myxococcales bacterium]|nr:hypothetical protein [Myxococcales bacterium]
MQSEFDTTTKLLFVLTGFMVIMAGLVMYVALFRESGSQFAAVAEAGARAPDAPAGEACDATSLEGSICPDGKYCRFDTCVPITQSNVCAEGESCRDCECDQGLLCHQFRCTREDQVDKTPLECAENRQLAEAVRSLATKCASRKTSVDQIASTGSCSTADWEALALEDEKFDLLLSAFPNRVAMHFPPGKPHPRRQDWPTPAVRTHLLAQIRQFQAALRGSKQIFVIGRASPDGDPKDNHLLAVRRMDLASNLIEAVLYEGVPETERDAHRVPIRSFTLPTTNPINPVRYRKSYLNNPDGSRPAISPIVAWDAANQRNLQTALDGGLDLEDRNSRDWQDLYGAINRVVMIIPIPCFGDEYEQRKSVLDRPAAAR